MRFLSVCSGIEAASVAWAPIGWKAAAFAEIEPFPCAVLKHHYPEVPNLGDMSRYQEWPDLGPIDLLCGGTPCQSFSVAGLRAGLDDPRGNLMLTYGAIAARYRPRWLVWENVCGVLSSNGGRDFGSFLGLLGHIGYGFAYRVLDAQYVCVDGYPHAVPQRRQRVFVVGYLGDWRRAAAVLLERESLLGNPPPSRKAREGASFRGKDGPGDCRWPALIAPTLNAAFGDKQGLEDQHALSGAGLFVPDYVNSITAHNGSRNEVSDIANGCVVEVAPTIPARSTGGGGLRTDFDCDGGVIAMASGQGGADIGFDRGPTLTCNHEAPIVGHFPHAFDARQSNVVKYGDMTGPLDTDGHSVAVAFDTTQITSKTNRSNPQPGDACHTLAKAAEAPAIAFDARQSDVIQYGEKTGPLDTCGFTMGVKTSTAVRRLTPVECSRLMGFPDSYLDITFRGKPAADGPKYRALGNSWAVNCARWVGRRIELMEQVK